MPKFSMNIERIDHAYSEWCIIDGYFHEDCKNFDDQDAWILENEQLFKNVFDYIVIEEKCVVALDCDGHIQFVKPIDEWYEDVLHLLKKFREENKK